VTASTITLLLAVFAASAVEMVEALTIVVAVGVTRGWRSALEGAASAVALLVVVIGAVGVPIVRYVPLATIRVVVGTLLLVMGESWLRKAVLRASGHKAAHDEDLIFAETCNDLSTDEPPRSRRDGVAFGVAFKGVFLEGIEVAIIVISLGGSQHRLGLAAAGAGAALVVVTAVGLVVARQLSEVPENLIKWGVGVMLTSLGVFWMGEGVGIRWPGGDLAIPVLVGVFLGATLAMAALLKARPRAATLAAAARRP
jgi:Ca2+/H+ antiporter, TMEM165/GDT1 family